MDYVVVDVFTNEPLKGNPVAVVLNAASLSTEQMQQIANWTNLSESTFVLPPTSPRADYRVRIFTPMHELPFAGHPSLGTAHVLLERGLVDASKSQIIQECLRGEIPIDVKHDGENQILAFGVGDAVSKPVDPVELDGCLPGLTITGRPSCINLGPKWIVAEVENPSSDVLSLAPNFGRIIRVSEKLDASGICVYSQKESGPNPDSTHVRTFAPFVGINEDPVCGSGNAAVAHYRNLNSPYTAFQGSCVRRNGVVSIEYRDNKVWVGGPSRAVVVGKINL